MNGVQVMPGDRGREAMAEQAARVMNDPDKRIATRPRPKVKTDG
jgi:hypothetical protein